MVVGLFTRRVGPSPVSTCATDRYTVVLLASFIFHIIFHIFILFYGSGVGLQFRCCFTDKHMATVTFCSLDDTTVRNFTDYKRFRFAFMSYHFVCVCWLVDTAPVEESPTIYSVLRQDEERKEQKLEKDRPVNASKPNNNVPVSSNSVGSKKNPSLGKKAVEKKKDKAPVLEEALTEVCNAFIIHTYTSDEEARTASTS